MSSSGLIYAVIVGAWAAYLVPMWLRRQDELNESRPTERFSTAIRLLAGRSAMERRAARALGEQTAEQQHPAGDPDGASADPADVPTRPAAWDGEAAPADPQPAPGAAAEPEESARPAAAAEPAAPDEGRAGAQARAERGRDHGEQDGRRSAERRARLLARRRRMVTLLFVAFALGAVVAAVAGFAFLWVPAVPGILLTLYIGHLRRLERQRYEVKFDRVRAAQAAERLRERERARAAEPAGPAPQPAEAPAEPATRASALAEATEHEEWADGVRARAAAGPDSWEPVPVPLPTYVTAPVAPRVTRGLDLSAPDAWDSGRPATPLFDQYGEPGQQQAAPEYRPRAANE
ncbi:gephyrin-like molybdotransferase receptor GlpR [Kitasatospora sp. NPDC059646]|uniref:divisome protein SepX/GlpR n=1 Tax=Kitasatospora sp. NPDC059646 TaxID=3346893 RepID=UPI00369EC49D